MSKQPQDRYWTGQGPEPEPFYELVTDLGTIVVPDAAHMRDQAYMRTRFQEIGFELPRMGPSEWQEFVSETLGLAAENSANSADRLSA